MTRSATSRTPNLEQHHLHSPSKQDLNKVTNCCFRCGKKLVALPILGFSVFSVGLLLGVGSFSVKGVTTSSAHVESKVPSFVTGTLMILTGIHFVILFKARPRCLVVLSIILSCMSGLLCFLGAMHTLMEVSPMFSSFDSCQYFTKGRMCKCFSQSDLRQVSYIFKGTENCKAIQIKLRDLVYGFCGIYSLGFALALLAALAGCLLLCPMSLSKVMIHSRSDGDGRCTVTSRQSQTSQTNLSTLSGSELELLASGVNQATVATQTAPQAASFVRTPVSCSPCSHYVVEMSMPRRDYCISFESPERHEPPPPYSEIP